MNTVLEIMLNKYNPQNDQEKENAIKEILQEIALAGLSRGGFFDVAAFYGGTCLRIFHGLDRFSEDLDFALIEKKTNFNLEQYFPFLEREFQSFGIEMKAESKIKKESDIQKGFLKGNTVSLMMTFYPNSFDAKRVIADQKIKIKFEIDVDNPIGGKTELRYQYLPSPYEIQIFDAPTLFAGKICALLFRAYQNRVKGRDFYDYLFYVKRGTKINMTYLSNKIKNQIDDRINKQISLDELKSMLKTKFETVDYENAKLDVIHFINDIDKLRYWNKDFFLSTLDLLKKDN